MTAPVFSDAQLRRLTVEGLKGSLSKKLGGMIRVVKDIRADNVLFRGVEWGRRPTLISEVSYPPPDKVGRFGRLNRPGHSMFYASRAAPAVFYELRARVGSCIAFSTWELHAPLWMHNLGYHAEAIARMGSQVEAMRVPLTEPIPNESRHNRRLRKQVALAFTEDVPDGQEHRYKQSVAIGEFWAEHHQPLPIYPDGPRTSQVAGFVYPSLQMKGAADNVAVFPPFVHSSLALRQVQYVLVEQTDTERLAFTFLTLAISSSFSNGTTIEWSDKLPPEKARRCHVALEGDAWVQRDGSGQIYGVNPCVGPNMPVGGPGSLSVFGSGA